MTLRRDFLAFTAGAMVAKTGLPLAVRAETIVRAPDDGPDAELIAVCAGHAARIEVYSRSDAELPYDEDPLWLAYERSRDFISAAKPVTLEGVLAKARAAKAEAVGLDGEDHPGGSMGEIWAWDLVGDLLALKAAVA